MPDYAPTPAEARYAAQQIAAERHDAEIDRQDRVTMFEMLVKGIHAVAASRRR
jgi:hypothetical protein